MHSRKQLANLVGIVASEDVRYFAFLAATGSVQRVAGKGATTIGSQDGVHMLRQYLKGGALQAVKQALRQVAVTFTRKALERAIPFGIGAAIGGGANYGLTRDVGHQAKQWFIIDQTMEPEDTPGAAAARTYRL